MRLTDEQPALAHKLLRRIEKMHGELMRETRVKSLFAIMVDVARAQRKARRQLNATELRAVSIARVAVRIGNAAASTGCTRAVQQNVDIRR
jgi:hypothetical protein